MKQVVAIVILVLTVVLTVTFVGSDFQTALPIDGGGLLAFLVVVAFWPGEKTKQQKAARQEKAPAQDKPKGGVFASLLPPPSQLQIPSPQMARPTSMAQTGATRQPVTVEDVTQRTTGNTQHASRAGAQQQVSTPVRPALKSAPAIPTIHLGMGVNGGAISLPLDSTMTSGLILELMQNTIPMASRLFMERWGKETMPLLLIDMTGGSYCTLAPVLSKGCIAGCAGAQSLLPQAASQVQYLSVRADNARAFGKHLMEKRLQVIFSFASYLLASPPDREDPASLAGKILMDILDGMREWEEQSQGESGESVQCVVMVTEAHKVIPQRDADGIFPDRAVVKALRGQLLELQQEQGAYGIWLYLVTPLLYEMHALAAQNIPFWVVNRYPEEDDLEQVSALTSLESDLFIHKSDADAFVILRGGAWAGQVVILRQTRSQHLAVALPNPQARKAAVPPKPQTGAAAQAGATDATTPARAQGAFSYELGAFACYLLAEQRLHPDLLHYPTGDLLPLLYALRLVREGEQAGELLSEERTQGLYLAVTRKLTPDRHQEYTEFARKCLASYQKRQQITAKEALPPANTPQPAQAPAHALLPTPASAPGTTSRAAPVTSAQPVVSAPQQAPAPPAEKTVVPANAANNQNSSWQYPSLSLFTKAAPSQHAPEKELQTMATRIEEALKGYKVYTKVLLDKDKTTVGPTVTNFAVELTGKEKMVEDALGNLVPARNALGEPIYEDGKRSTFAQLQARNRDLAMALKTGFIRMTPQPQGYVGVEIPNKQRSNVRLIEILESQEYREMQARSKLTIALGKNTAGRPRVFDFRRAPHALVGGTTGSGKSTFLDAFICSILYNASPEEVQFLMVDPKGVEFEAYKDIPHLREEIVTDPDLAENLFTRTVTEMERRYKLFKRVGATYNRQVKKIDEYHALQRELAGNGDATLAKPLPYIVLIVDELADLMLTAPDSIEESIFRLAQMARATGIHLIIATQRPSVQVVTGDIKANIGTRMAFKLPSLQDSRTILDMGGAEWLLGNGDMLFKPQETGLERIQSAIVDEGEKTRLIKHWCQQATRTSMLAQKASPVTEHEDDDEPITDAQQLEMELEEQEDEPETTPSKVTMALSEEEKAIIKELKWLLQIGRSGRKASTSLVQRGLYGGYSKAAKTVDRFAALGLIGEPDPVTKFREIFQDKVIALLKEYGEEPDDAGSVATSGEATDEKEG